MAETEPFGREIKPFVEDLAEWEARCLWIKQCRCPHCLIQGTLTRHGKLYGYTLATVSCRIQKGFRLLCSNRHRYHGCGRTVSVRFSSVLRRCMVNAQDMWLFVRGLLAGERCFTAARRLSIATSPASPYRWKARLERAQLGLRSILQPHLSPSASHRVLPGAWLQPYDQLRELTSDDAIRWL